MRRELSSSEYVAIQCAAVGFLTFLFNVYAIYVIPAVHRWRHDGKNPEHYTSGLPMSQMFWISAAIWWWHGEMPLMWIAIALAVVDPYRFIFLDILVLSLREWREQRRRPAPHDAK